MAKKEEDEKWIFLTYLSGGTRCFSGRKGATKGKKFLVFKGIALEKKAFVQSEDTMQEVVDLFASTDEVKDLKSESRQNSTVNICF